MDNNTVIVSMTSYPARIDGVAAVWRSILRQNVDNSKYHCVLVLADPEFPQRKIPEDLKTLVDLGRVELIWYPRNIRSHKKLMPVLKKYPDNPILVIDDDVLRETNWLEIFMSDHEKYPNDIIAGTFSYHLDKNLVLQRMTDFKQKNAGGKNNVPGLIFNFARPANGCGGTLYPAHTFTDKRFFDEELMMRLSPTSDESWQYCFNIIKDMTMRQTSVVTDESESVVPGSQKLDTCLYKVNKTKYPEIFKLFFKEFPEFKEKLIERQNRAVISLTSYPERYRTLPKVLDSLLNQRLKLKICIVLTKDEQEKLTPEVKKYIESNQVELITAAEDLKPHKKYFYAMQKYPNHAVITVDDDRIYSPNAVSALMDGYRNHPNCVIARRVHCMRFDKEGKPLPYNKWNLECETIKTPSGKLFATGCGGILYPPSILGINEENLPEIRETLTVDDIYLKHLETEKGIKVFYVGGHKCDTHIADEDIQKNALFKENIGENKNDNYTHLVKKTDDDPHPIIKVDKFTPRVVHGKMTWMKTHHTPTSKSWSNFLK